MGMREIEPTLKEPVPLHQDNEFEESVRFIIEHKIKSNRLA
jgi:hypothetical protein